MKIPGQISAEINNRLEATRKYALSVNESASQLEIETSHNSNAARSVTEATATTTDCVQQVEALVEIFLEDIEDPEILARAFIQGAA